MSSQAVNTTRMIRLSQWTTTPLTPWFAGIPMKILTSDTRIAWKVTDVFIVVMVEPLTAALMVLAIIKTEFKYT